MSRTTITIKQAKDQLVLAAKQYFSKDACGAYRLDRRRARPICLMGPAGLGKTEVVRQVAEEQGLGFVSYSITHHTRQSLLGLPQLREVQLGGETVTATRYTMSEIITDIWQEMERTGRKEGILFLDEFNAAAASLHPVMLQLLQNKALGQHSIPDGWMLVVAGNPSDSNRSAERLDAVTADRLRMLRLRPDLAAWKEYMMPRGIHPLVLAYLECYSEDLHQLGTEDGVVTIVTPRAWEDLSLQLYFYEQEGAAVGETVIGQVIQNEAVAKRFWLHYKKKEQALYRKTASQLEQGLPLNQQWERLRALQKQDVWALTAFLADRIQRMCRQAAEEEQALETLHGVLQEALGSGDCVAYLRGLSGEHPSSTWTFVQSYLEQVEEDPSGDGLRTAYQTGPLARRGALVDRACAMLEHTIDFCRRCYPEQPQMEYLVESIARDKTCQSIVSLRETPLFTAAGRELYVRKPKTPARKAV